MSRRCCTSLVAVVVLAMTGCGQTGATIPTIAYSQSTGYAVVPFKDDAPANATVTEFPLAFVDWQGMPVDLTQYRGKKKGRADRPPRHAAVGKRRVLSIVPGAD